MTQNNERPRNIQKTIYFISGTILFMFLVLMIGNLDLVTPAPECLYVLVHVPKTNFQITDMKVVIGRGGEGEFLASKNLLGVLVEPRGDAFRLLLFGILQIVIVVPDLESASRHHEKALNVVLQAAVTAVLGRLRAAADAEQVCVAARRPLLAPPDVLVIGATCSLAAGFVEQDSAHAAELVPM